MKEETKVNLIAMLGEEKANNIFKQTEESARLKKIAQDKEAAHLVRMELSMIGKTYLISGEYYNGYRWRGKHVAMWDGEKGCFKTINFKMGSFFIEDLPYFGDVKDTNQDGFIPFEKIEPRTI